MDDLNKRVRREAIKLVAVGAAIGFLLGLGVGALVVDHFTERVVIIPLQPVMKV